MVEAKPRTKKLDDFPYDQDEYQNREDWLAGRQGTIGASDAATIMGCNPWNTHLALYGRLCGLLPPREQPLFNRIGHWLEPRVATLYEEESGHKTSDPGDFTIQRNADCPWMHCTVDRFIIVGKNGEGDGVLEAKVVGHRLRGHWKDGIPLYVQVQVQHQLAVTGLEWGAAAAVLGIDEFVWAVIPRNQPFIDGLLTKTKEFAERVAANDPPPATGKDNDTLRLLYPKHVMGRVIELPDEACEHDVMLQRVKKQIATAEAAKDWHESQLKEMLGDAEIGQLPGGGSYSWKSAERVGFTVKPTKTRTLRRHKG